MANTSVREEWWKNISFEAVFSGAFAGLFVTLIAGLALVLFVYIEDTLGWGNIFVENGPLSGRIPLIATSLPFIVLFLLWIGLSNVIGGYVAASIAPQNKILNATLASFPFVLLWLTSLVILGSTQFSYAANTFTLFLSFTSLLSNILLSLTGGYIRLRQVDNSATERKSVSVESFRLSPEKRGLLHGRMNRKNFMLSFAATSSAFVILMLVFINVSILIGIDLSILTIGAIGLFSVFQISISVRRFHDMNLSGWFSVGLLIPYVWWIFLILLLLVPGSKDKNKYGSPSDSFTLRSVFTGK
ncbi:DUF805 domain-containing protein [Candidatus Kaiserbacteria bacterium]|nr:DUF805 domain-containing protein [Candidatus Kaiserbacteria bacterium]